MPRVSVIIPTYNREKYVINAIESVLCQQFKDYEIIVVDDGSKDNTKENLRKYQDKIKYIYQVNLGVSAARNAGIKFARGEWLAFLDSDDEWMPEYLLQQIEKASLNPDICMQTTDCLVTELDGKKESYFEINGSLPEFDGRDYLFIEKPLYFILKHGPWQIGSTIILHEAIKKAGLFDTSLKISEDLELMARMALQGPFGMIRKVLLNVYRRNEATECLTEQVKKDPIGVRESGEKIYEKLKRIEELRHKEIQVLNDLLSANRRAIGNLLIKNGKIKEARNSYERAFFISPSIASLSKYILSFLPERTNLWMIERNSKLKEKKKKCYV
jgi:glycosyltransferase involved in cell wall biosynthesis